MNLKDKMKCKTGHVKLIYYVAIRKSTDSARVVIIKDGRVELKDTIETLRSI